MPVTALIIGTSIKAVSGIAKGVNGYVEKRRGKKLLENLGERPEYEIPEEYKTNQNLAKYYGQQGLDAQTLYNYRQGLERGLTSTTSAVLNAGGSINSISRAYDQYATGLNKVAGLNFQALQANRKALMQANSDYAVKKDDAFAFDLMNYNTDEKRARGLIKSGNEGMIGGINDVGTSILEGVTAYQQGQHGKSGVGGGNTSALSSFNPELEYGEGFEENTGVGLLSGNRMGGNFVVPSQKYKFPFNQ